MQQYLAFLRGINVGGKGLIKMAELKDCLLASGLSDVRTYIQSGNVFFRSDAVDTQALGQQISAAIEQTFGLHVSVAIFSKEEWQRVIQAAPAWWGMDKEWKHNILILIKPVGMETILKGIGTLKPGIEALQAGQGILYQSIACDAVGQGATGSKLIATSAYGNITVRNYNTATKLASLFSEES